MNGREIKVWDSLIRIFHWSLVAAFAIAYLTDDEWLDIHNLAGYMVLALIGFRLIWGFIGPRYARFSNFVSSPSATMAYLCDLLRLRNERYIGHNPAGGWMIVMLLVSLLITSLTGLVVYAAEEQAGPLAGLVYGLPWDDDIAEELHEVFANITLMLVVIHVAGVVFESFIHKENLVRAMVTGNKRV